MKKTSGRATSRRDSLRLLAAALAAPALFARGAAAQEPGREPPAAAPQPEAAPGGGGPWPSAEKLMKANGEHAAQLARVRLSNADAPDALPRPPLPGAQRKGGRR